MGKVNIGLKQAQRLAQLSPQKRLAFLAQGLPLLRNSAIGFWEAAEALETHARERRVLEGFAAEEAAKGLILMDIVRCPPMLLKDRMQPMISWFYNHLARLIYAAAANWKPLNIAQLQGYADTSRQAHYLEGYAGEYIVPNWEEYRRESQLYVDIAAYEDGEPVWNTPINYDWPSIDFRPAALEVIDALHHLGITSEAGLRATSEIWSTVTFRDAENHEDAGRLTQLLLKRVAAEKLQHEDSTKQHEHWVYESWQMPMYLIDLRKKDVPLAQLRERQEAMLLSEIGY